MESEILEIALKEYGTQEFVGSDHNSEVLKYFSEAGFNFIKDDETAWCSAFINWCALKANKDRSKKLNARSWLKVGCQTYSPEIGDIAVFWRDSPESWKGHVGLFIRSHEGWVYVLGGNQNNQVGIKAYPESQLLQYRKL